MTTVSLGSSQSYHSIGADNWCKQALRGWVPYLDCSLELWRHPPVLVLFSAVFTRDVFVQQVLHVERLVTDRTRKLTTRT